MKKTKFSRLEWWFTRADENLFLLTREELYLCRLLIAGSWE